MEWILSSGLALAKDVVLLIFGLVGLWQLLEWRNARRMRVLADLNDRFLREDVRRARRTVYNLPDDATPESAAHWPDEAKSDTELVCSTFDLAGLLAAEGVVPANWLAHNWRFALTRCWDRAEPLVEHYRRTRAPDYWHNFEKLARRAQTVKV